MSDQIVSQLGLDASDFIGETRNLEKVLKDAENAMLSFAGASAQFDKDGKLLNASIKTTIDGVKELTEYFGVLRDDEGKITGFGRTGTASLRSLTKEFQDVSEQAKLLSHNLTAFSGRNALEAFQGNLIKEFVPTDVIKKGTDQEIFSAQRAVQNLQEELQKLTSTGQLTEKEIYQVANAFKSGNFIEVTETKYASLIRRVRELNEALDNVGSSARVDVKKIKTPSLATFEAAKKKLEQALDISGIANVNDKQAARLNKAIEKVLDYYYQTNNIKLDRFQEIVKEAYTTTVNSFEGQEKVLFKFARQAVDVFQQINTTIDQYKARLSGLASSRPLVSNKLGTPLLSQNVDTTTATRLINRYSSIINRINKEKIKVNIDDTAFEKIVDDLRQNAANIEHLDEEYRNLGTQILNAINLQNRFGDISAKANEKARRSVDANLKAQQATAQQAQVLANTPNIFDQVSKIGLQKFNIPLKALNFTDVERLKSNFAEVSVAIAKGSINLQDYINQLDKIRNKEILPPDANAAINQLRTNLAAIASTGDHVTNRVNRLKDSIITMTNAMRLLVVSELYVMFSTLRSGIEQAIHDAQKLSIQIGQIQAITQETNTTTQEWAQTLREVSDLSGKSITEVSVAAYDSLSNQITKTKDDTKDFLNTALEFGRTVGATPTESVNLLSSAINAFGKSSKDARDLSAQFFAVIDIGRIKAADLQNIYGRAAIAGAKLGVTTQEMGAALAVLTQNGLTTEDAVTRLNNLFIKLINPTKEMEKLFTSLGITSGEQLIKMNGFAGAIQRIEASINNGNVALSELFPEIRTLVGFLGLSGQNAVKFSDALDQVKDSMGRFNQASKLTKTPFGQTFAEEFEKIKNIFAVDYFGQLQEGIAKISLAFGGIADKIKFVIDRSLELAKVAGAVASVYLVYKNAVAVMTLLNNITKANTISMVALTGATKGTLTALLATPWGLFAVAAAAAFAAASIALDHFEESTKRLNEELRKTGEKKYLSSGLKRDFDEVVKDSNKLYTDLSGTLQKVFGTVAQRISTSYTIIIENQKKKVKELVDTTKSAFDDIQNIIGKTISAIENASKELGSIRRDLIKESIDYVASENRSALEDTLALQKQIDDARSQAVNEAGGIGVKGPTQKQLNIVDQLVQENKKSEGQLKDQIKNVLKNTYNVSEAKSLADDWLKTNKDSIDKYKELIREINSSHINPGQGFVGSQLSVKEINDRILALRQERDAFRSNLFGLLDETAKNKDSELAPALKLKDEVQSLQKQITDIDLEKIVSQAQDVRDNAGNIIESRAQQINKALAPYRKAQEELVNKVNTISPQLKKAGLFSDFQVALQNLQKQIDSLNAGRLELIVNQIKFDSITKGTKAFEALNREVEELNERLNKTDTNLQKLLGEFNQITPNIKPITSGTYVNPIFNKLNIQTKLLQEQLNKPIDANYLKNVKSAADSVETELSKLRGQFPNITNNLSTSLGELRNKLEEIFTTTEHQEVLKRQFDKVNQAVYNLSKEVSSELPAALLTTEEKWKEMATSIEGFNEKNIASTQRLIEVLSKANALTNQLGIRPENKAQGSPEGAIVPVPENHALGGKIAGYAHGGRIAAATAMSQFSPGLHKLNRGGIDALSSAHKKTPFHYAVGGPVGTDTVPAWLTPGEFVMPRKETEMFLPILEAMRKKTFVPQVYGMGGRVYNYSSGGKVNNTTNNHQNIHVTIYGQADESLGRKIGREIQREVRRGNVKLS